tara:strand:- start:179 stop:4609 length:4431 start_codon:yes stop_codon:yes gene_type:complete
MDKVRTLQLQQLLGKQLADDQITDAEYRRFLRQARVAADQERVLQMITAPRARRALTRHIRWEKEALNQVKPKLVAREQLGSFGWFQPGTGELGVGGLIDPAHVTVGAMVAGTHRQSADIASTMMNWMSPTKNEATTFHEGLHGLWQYQMKDEEKDIFRQYARDNLHSYALGFWGTSGDVTALVNKAPAYANMARHAAAGNELGLDMVANELWAHRGTARVFDTDDMYRMTGDRVQDMVMDKYIKNTPGTRYDMTASYTGFEAGAISLAHLDGQDAGDVMSALRTPDNQEIPFDVARSYSARSPVVHGQRISDEIVDFREEWMSSPEKKKELERRKKDIPIQYGDIDSSRLTSIGGGKAEVDISGWNPVWEDVDTLLLERGMFEDDIAIRLTGIDSPEVSHPGDPTEWFRFRQEQPFGEKALAQLREQVENGQLRVVVDADPGARTYNRYLGLIYEEGEEESLNMQFVRQGLAASLPFGDAGSDMLPREEFMAAEHEAIQDRRGMWNLPFYQKYLALSAGVGGRLTFNTFTDLSRMGKNYHLAAAHEALWSDSATTRDAYRIGEKLVPSHGRFFGKTPRRSKSGYLAFSGFDDDYNTIEGLSERGMASMLRKENTEFGSGWKGGLGIVGMGAAAIGTLRAFGAASGKQHQPEPDEGMGWLAKTAIGTGVIAGLALAGPTLGGALLLRKAGAGWKQAFSSASAGWATTKTGIKIRVGALLGTHRKASVDRLRASASEHTGLYSSSLGRAFSPIKGLGHAVDHTATWMGKNWLPELKKLEPGAVGLGALSAYDAYHMGTSAHEGDWGGVATGAATFAGAKYAYMGYHKFLRNPALRQKALGWAKQQTGKDLMGYAGMGLSAMGTAREAAMVGASGYVSFVRTGAGAKQYLGEYGMNMARAGTAGYADIRKSMTHALNKVDPGVKDEILRQDWVRHLGELEDTGRQGIQSGRDFLELDETKMQAGIQGALDRAGLQVEGLRRQAWSLGEATERIAGADAGVATRWIKENLSAANIDMAIGKGQEQFRGLQHGGMAQQMRKSMTEFGSGWDPARKLIQEGIEQGFKRDVVEGAFRSSLREGKVVQALGSGTFADTVLMETQFGGKTIRYARKTISPQAEGRLEALIENKRLTNPQVAAMSGEEFGKYADEFRAAKRSDFDIGHEASILQKLEGAPAAPSFYMKEGDSLFMEAMPGDTLYKQTSKRSFSARHQVPEEAMAELTDTARVAAERGIVNLDIHGLNVMFDPKSGHASWLDWGGARMSKRTPRLNEDEMVKDLHGLPFTAGETLDVAAMNQVTKPHKPPARRSEELSIADMLSVKSAGGEELSVADMLSIRHMDSAALAKTARPGLGELPTIPGALTQADATTMAGMGAGRGPLLQKKWEGGSLGLADTLPRNIGYDKTLPAVSKRHAPAREKESWYKTDLAVGGAAIGGGSLILVAAQQATAQKQIWDAANNGGKGHLSRQSGKSVKHLSIYGG